MIQGIIFDYDGVLTKRYVSAYHMYQWIICSITNKEKSDFWHKRIFDYLPSTERAVMAKLRDMKVVKVVKEKYIFIE